MALTRKTNKPKVSTPLRSSQYRRSVQKKISAEQIRIPRTPVEEKERIAKRLNKKNRTQQYHVRVAFRGVIRFVCPFCGYIDRFQLGVRNYWISCHDCQAKFIPQLNLALIPPGGRYTIPPDHVIPDSRGPRGLQEAFPTGDLAVWRQGRCMHGMAGEEQVNTSDPTPTLRSRSSPNYSAQDLFNEVKRRVAAWVELDNPEDGRDVLEVMAHSLSELKEEWGLEDVEYTDEHGSEGATDYAGENA